jgi:hypothetical protein
MLVAVGRLVFVPLMAPPQIPLMPAPGADGLGAASGVASRNTALENMIQQVNYLWGGMVEIAGYSAQLIWFLGPAGLAGIAMMIALVPMQARVSVPTA